MERKEPDRNYGQIAAAGESHFSRNLEHLAKSPEFAQHTPRELASVAYWRGVYRGTMESVGEKFDGQDFDKTMRSRENAAKLPEPLDIERMEQAAKKTISRTRDEGLSL